MAEVASAYVSLLPSAKGFGKQLDRSVAGDVAKSGRRAGLSFGKLFAVGIGLGVGRKAFSFLGDALGEAREAQVIGARTKNVIAKMGDAANISADQVAKLAESISNKTGIDDEAIQSGQNLLLTFGNIRNEAGKGNDIFNQATVAMVDYAAATGGEAKGAAIALGKALNDPLKGLTALGKQGVSFSEVQKKQIEGFVESGDSMKAQKIILGELDKQFGKAAESMATPAEKAKVAWGNFKEEIGTNLLPVVDKVLTFFTKKALPAIDGAKDSVADFFDAVSKNEAAITAFETLKDAAGALRDGLGKAVGKAKKIGDALGSIDLTKMDPKDLGKKLGGALTTALGALVKGAAELTKKLGDLFAKVDWVGLGITIGKYVPALLLGLAAGILNFDIDNLFSGIGDHWGAILLGVLTIAFAPSKLIGPLTKILSKIPFVGPFLARAVTWLNQLGGKLASFGGDLFKALWKGLTGGKALPGAGLVAKVMSAFKSLPGRIKDFFDTLRIRIGVYALEAFEAMGKGAARGTVAVIRFVASIPGKILSALGSLIKFLFPKGTELVQGLIAGLRGKAGDAIGFVKSLPGKFLAIFANAGTLLLGAGERLMSGLAAGIQNKIDDAINAVKAGLAKIKGMLPGSPIQWGPLKNWNNGGAGKRLMDLVARGITAGGNGPLKAAEEAFGKIESALEKTRDNLRSTLDGLKSDFASLADSVASAFTGDLFGVSATEADAEAGVAGKTVGQAFVDNLLGKKAELTGLLASFKTLVGWGLDPSFLSQLFASGNGGLITELAGMGQAGAASTASLFGEVVDLGAQLGNAVAQNDPVTDRIDITNTKLTEAVNQLTFLNNNIDKKLGAAVKQGAREGTREGNNDRNADTKQRGKAGR